MSKDKISKLTSKIRSKYTGKDRRRYFAMTFIVGFALIGATVLILSHAAGFSISIEPELGTPGGCAKSVSDSSASGGSAIQFCSAGTGGGGSTGTPGAHLPITYSSSILTGTVRYVDDTGSDSNSGSSSSPYATLAKAISASASGDSIVVKGGTYRQGGLAGGGNVAKVTKKLNIYAASGETPVFIGSRQATSWTTSGSLKYTSYTELPTDGSTDYATTDPIGKNADQAWVGSKRLKQVSSQSAVVDGKFWVDATNNRLYMTATDVNKGSVEVSNYDQLFWVAAANVKIAGLSIQRYSDPAARYGVIRMEDSSDNSTISDVEILDSAEMALKATGTKSPFSANNGVTLKNVTISGSGWMGVNANLTDNFTMDSVKISNLNLDGEYSSSPQSGALKTSRTRYTKVLNSEFSNINSVGLWFDQSNYDVDVANSTITGATGASIFFEISDDLLRVNNYIDSTKGVNALEVAGSSGVKLVNNTFVGDSDPLAFYVDKRGTPNCWNPSSGCTYIYAQSDWDPRPSIPPTLDWVTRLDLMVNNVIVKTGTSRRYCGTSAPLCLTQSNGTAVSSINTEIHKADSLRPQTFMDDNIYANNGGGNVVGTQNNGNFSSASAWSSFLAGSPVSIANMEVGSKSGTGWASNTGTPTSTLAAIHNQATAVPGALTGKFPTATINNIKEYLPSGDTQHYGVFNK